MAWFRTNRGVAAWLALFALACQLSLTFGHVHGRYPGTFGDGPAVSVALDAVDSSAGAPSHPRPLGLPVDFCAVCANINLAGALLLPIIALIVAPLLITSSLRWLPPAPALASRMRRPLGARGPPGA